MNTTSIALLKAAIEGPTKLSVLQKKLGIKEWALNNNIRNLREQGYVEKDGLFLKIQHTSKAQQLRDLSKKIDIENIMRESNEILLSYLTEPITVNNLIIRSGLSRATVYRFITDIEKIEGFRRQEYTYTDDKGIRRSEDILSIDADSPLSFFAKLLQQEKRIEDIKKEEFKQLLEYKYESKSLTLDELKKHLWGAADVLRGTLDANEYRQPIMTLLYLKRINDTFEEKYNELRKKTNNEKWLNDKDQYDVFVPENARWKILVNTFENIGEKLDEICEEIEHQDPILEGILTNTHYNDKKRYPDDVLLELIAHFNKISLTKELIKDDVFGQAYEYLLEQFADSAGKKAGEFFTPREVVQLLVELLQPKEGMRICDPTCGSGGMLIWAHKYLKKNPDDLDLHGQERNFGNYGMCKMNLLLHGIKKFRIMHENVLKNPLLVENGKLIDYDLVLANFPFSMDWDSSNAANDPYGRFRFGIPPSKGKADFAFIQHIYSILKNNGRAAIICSQGILFRSGEETKIRQRMIEPDIDVVEAVIELPSNLFYGTGIPACVIILNRNKPDDRKQNILFIHASNDFEDLKKRVKLRPTDIRKIVDAYKNYANDSGYCHVASFKEIQENEFNFNVSRYVDTTEPEPPIDIKYEINALKNLEKEREKTIIRMNQDLRELGFND